ncbi:MAG: hypothetical protein Q2306_00205 [Phytoplasma sp.]|uniref:hypothetical protein n=1 Tax=Phytoplasma sp. TaxID=2155 RepID=UPI002B40FE70|nr:hypothetical protein [Phytoplasma sp.]WRH06774.1 MAG: hypothetical protein Q2306_00205 [Phytoplasma sp.]
MTKFSLKKIIVISFILSMSLIIEIILTKTIFHGHNCESSILKLELLPLFLIGFLFGLKYSFFSNLLYTFIHITLESNLSFGHHSLLRKYNNNISFLYMGVLLFLFIIPYLSCSLTGLFYSEERNKSYKKQNILKSLLLITIIQIISYTLFVYIFYTSHAKEISDNIFHNHDSCQNEETKSNTFLILYFCFTVIITNIISGFCLFFIKNIVQKNIEFIS